MSPEIEKLIKYAVADGEITEKERAVIMRKAESLGEDLDEVEMIINGELVLLKKQLSPPKSNKEGDIKKCPSCGAPVPSLSLKCSECGHEFRNTEASQSIAEFYKHLKSSNIADRATIISNFPVPNNKEDLIEFITLSVGNSRSLDDEERQTYVKNAWSGTFKPELHYRESEISAWQGKSEAAIMKAKLLFSTDEQILAKIKMYENQYFSNKNFKQKQKSKKMKYALILVFAYILFMLIMFILM